MRYIDDLLIIAPPAVHRAFRYGYDPSQKVNISKNNTFLDIKYTKHHTLDPQTGLFHVHFTTDIHQKELNKYDYTNFKSTASIQGKRALVIGELIRYARTCENWSLFQRIKNAFWNRLLRRQYPVKFIAPIFNKFTFTYCRMNYPVRLDLRLQTLNAMADLCLRKIVIPPPILKTVNFGSVTPPIRRILTQHWPFNAQLLQRIIICNFRLPNLMEELNEIRQHTERLTATHPDMSIAQAIRLTTTRIMRGHSQYHLPWITQRLLRSNKRRELIALPQEITEMTNQHHTGVVVNVQNSQHCTYTHRRQTDFTSRTVRLPRPTPLLSNNNRKRTRTPHPPDDDRTFVLSDFHVKQPSITPTTLPPPKRRRLTEKDTEGTQKHTASNQLRSPLPTVNINPPMAKKRHQDNMSKSNTPRQTSITSWFNRPNQQSRNGEPK